MALETPLPAPARYAQNAGDRFPSLAKSYAIRCRIENNLLGSVGLIGLKGPNRMQ
jgi:hypothetical protein